MIDELPVNVPTKISQNNMMYYGSTSLPGVLSSYLVLVTYIHNNWCTRLPLTGVLVLVPELVLLPSALGVLTTDSVLLVFNES